MVTDKEKELENTRAKIKVSINICGPLSLLRVTITVLSGNII
jgi:hypothetical protein